MKKIIFSATLAAAIILAATPLHAQRSDKFRDQGTTLDLATLDWVGVGSADRVIGNWGTTVKGWTLYNDVSRILFNGGSKANEQIILDQGTSDLVFTQGLGANQNLAHVKFVGENNITFQAGLVNTSVARWTIHFGNYLGDVDGTNDQTVALTIGSKGVTYDTGKVDGGTGQSIMAALDGNLYINQDITFYGTGKTIIAGDLINKDTDPLNAHSASALHVGAHSRNSNGVCISANEGTTVEIASGAFSRLEGSTIVYNTAKLIVNGTIEGNERIITTNVGTGEVIWQDTLLGWRMGDVTVNAGATLTGSGTIGNAIATTNGSDATKINIIGGTAGTRGGILHSQGMTFKSELNLNIGGVKTVQFGLGDVVKLDNSRLTWGDSLANKVQIEFLGDWEFGANKEMKLFDLQNGATAANLGLNTALTGNKLDGNRYDFIFADGVGFLTMALSDIDIEECFPGTTATNLKDLVYLELRGATETSVGSGIYQGGSIWVVGAAAAPIPEPSTWLLLGAGAAVLVIFRRRKQS